MACTCNVGPGKFEGEGAAIYLAYFSYLDGNANDTGTVLLLDAFEPTDAEQWCASEYGYCADCIAAACLELATAVGIALEESETGFVSGRVYASTDAGDWQALCRRLEQGIEDDEDAWQ
jgi:hypothetical protein